VWQLAAWHRGCVAGVEPSGEPSGTRAGGSASLRPQAPREKRLPRPFYVLAVGVLGGVATLIRPSWLLFTPAIAALAVVIGRDKKRLASFGLMATAALALTMLPWWIRNWHVTGRFVPTTLEVGASLYDGLSPHADGSSDMTHAAEFAERHRGGEYDLDRALRRAASTWAAAHPGEAVRLAGVKLTRMWNVWPNERSFRSWPARLIVAGSFVPVMVLAAIGAWRLRDRRCLLMLALAPAIYLTALHVVFVSSIRYRQPAMLPLMVLAAGAAGALRQRRLDKRP
jgi:hypothetical protein